MRRLLAALLCLAAAGCAGMPAAGRGTVRIEGSDTMLLLNRRLAVRFMQAHPGIAVEVSGGGSATGVRALVRGEVDICAASRPLESGEVEALYRRYDRLGVRFLVARDLLTVYLNRANPVHSLTTAQLRAIFAGQAERWSAVGGPDRPIQVITRPPTSGSYRFFQLHVLLGRPFTGRALTVPTTAAIVERVAASPWAVGYGGFAYVAGVRCATVDGVAPSTASAVDGTYPLARYLQFYTVAPPEGVVKAFIDWSLGPVGQATVAEVGYIPLWPAAGEAPASGCIDGG